jgi:hypothetical protein
VRSHLLVSPILSSTGGFADVIYDTYGIDLWNRKIESASPHEGRVSFLQMRED